MNHVNWARLGLGLPVVRFVSENLFALALSSRTSFNFVFVFILFSSKMNYL